MINAIYTGTKSFAITLMRGVGQVMFQGNAKTGLLMLIAIFYGAYANSTPAVAWGALVGCVTSTFSGYLLGVKRKEGREGMWGFNGILVGCAFPTFLTDTPLMWLALILCAASTTWIRQGFNNILVHWKINSLTFPFVFMTWLFLLASSYLDGLHAYGLDTPALAEYYKYEINTSPLALICYWLKGISQVFLINDCITGFMFLIALSVSSRWAAIWAGVGSAISLAIAILYTGNPDNITQGLFGFSPVLTGIAIGSTFYKPSLRSAAWSVIAIIFTVFVQGALDTAMLPYGLPTLTAPFCLTTWLFLLPMYKFDNRPDEVNHSEWHTIIEDLRKLEKEL
jgi:urea transporter